VTDTDSFRAARDQGELRYIEQRIAWKNLKRANSTRHVVGGQPYASVTNFNKTALSSRAVAIQRPLRAMICRREVDSTDFRTDVPRGGRWKRSHCLGLQHTMGTKLKRSRTLSVRGSLLPNSLMQNRPFIPNGRRSTVGTARAESLPTRRNGLDKHGVDRFKATTF